MTMVSDFMFHVVDRLSIYSLVLNNECEVVAVFFVNSLVILLVNLSC